MSEWPVPQRQIKVRDVSPNAFPVIKMIVASRGALLSEVCEGVIGISEAETQGFDWDQFCTLLERLETICGGPEELRREGATIIKVPELGPTVRIIRMVAGPQGLYWANFRWGGPSLFRIVTTSFRVIADGRYVGTIAIPNTHRHCASFFHFNAGVFSALPRALDLPDSQVELNITPNLGTYLIEAPPNLGFAARFRLAVGAVFTSREVVETLAAQNSQLALESREAERARAEAVEAKERAEEALKIAETQRAAAEEARMAAEAARAEALEALRAKSQFVSTMSHELRTPLNGMLGMTHLLAAGRLSAEQRDYVETIASSGGVLLQLINDVLDFSKLDAGRLGLDPTPTDLRELVESVLQAAGTRVVGRAVDVVGIVASDVAQLVKVDALRLRQVITNLVDNATKFTEKGEVILEIRSVMGNRNRLRCSVRDTGIGITPEQRARIFQPFIQADGSTTRQYGGTGLGLTISAMLVGAMGGSIAVDSEPGSGSTFSFEFDAEVVTERSPLPVINGRAGVLSSESVRAQVAVMLRDMGWELSDEAPQVLFVDTDHAQVPKVGPRMVLLSRSGTGEAGVSIRKPIRREDLRNAVSQTFSKPPSSPVTSRKKVAVLFEDALQRRIVCRFVTRLGHELTEEASVDVVVVHWTDDGSDPIAAARNRWPDAQRVVVASVEEQARCMELGADLVIPRPVEIEALGKALGI